MATRCTLSRAMKAPNWLPSTLSGLKRGGTVNGDHAVVKGGYAQFLHREVEGAVRADQQPCRHWL